MRWDVVEIGLNHDLPIEDPVATAELIAKRLNRNIRLVYQNKYTYDARKNMVTAIGGFEFVKVQDFVVNDSDTYLTMTATNYQANKILELAGIDRLRNAQFVNRRLHDLLSDLNNPFDLYEIEDEKGDYDIRIFHDTVDLGVYVMGGWSNWVRYFHDISEYRDILADYRKQIYERAKMFGCNEVIICCDQGPGEIIYGNMIYPAARLKEFVQTFQYLNGNEWLRGESVEEWKRKAKHIMFASAFENTLSFSDGDFIEVIFDDFAGI